MLQLIALVLFLEKIRPAVGHGLITAPHSRGDFCGLQTKPSDFVSGATPLYPVCVDAFNYPGIPANEAYNFMSMATHNLGYAVVGPVPNVCSFDSDFSVFQNTTTWTDVPIDWPLNNMSPGTQNFVWSIQWGPHFSDTFEFNFWITNADFVYTVGQNVTFADFESTQFCHQPYNASDTTANPNVVPNTTNSTFTVTCNVPARSGHHIIKAEWGRTAPTLERFHCCVDGLFGGTGTVVTTAAVSSTTTTTTTSTTTTTTTKSTTVIATTTNTTTSTATTKSSTTTVQTTIATSTSTGTASKACSAKYGQCGGLNWTGATCCVSSSCSVTNPYYSQCL